ncbi:TPA: phage portal protein, partial [Yersinia enterocolitica]
YKKSWVVKKYIDKTVADMLKLPRKFSGDVDSTMVQGIKDTESELKLSQVFNDALSWASLMGDSLIVAITDCADNQIANEVDLQGEEIVKFLVFRKGEYTPDSNIITDIKSDHFGEPLTYQIDVGSKQLKFHHSRCCRTKLGRHSIKDRAKFGTSDLQAPYEHIKTFDTAILSTGDTIQEANV